MSVSRAYRVLLIGAPEDRERSQTLLAAASDRFEVEAVAPEDVDRGIDEPPDLIVLAGLSNPLPIGRALRERSTSSQIVFLVAPEGLERFRRMLPFAPNLASAWTESAAAEPAALIRIFSEAARATRDRVAVATMMGQINAKLTGQSVAAQQRHSQLALSERYLATILTQSPDAFVAVDPSRTVTAFNDAAVSLFGPALKEEERISFLSLLPSDQRAAVDDSLRRALAGEVPPRHEIQFGAQKHAVFGELSFAPVHIGGSVVDAVSITARDITERKRAEERQRLLINELNHRVKNTLAIVQALAHQSFRGSAPPEEERARFEARLRTLAAAHGLLTQQSWEAISLAELARETVSAACGGAGRQHIEGPDVWLAPQTAVAIAMALHELCTNAIKYGSLSADTGAVTVRWRTATSANGERLHLEWVERGGPSVQKPTRRGFGLRMIENGLSAELNADVDLRFEAQGLVCTIDAPLPEGAG